MKGRSLGSVLAVLGLALGAQVVTTQVARADGDIPGVGEDPSGPAYDTESIYETIGEIFGEATEVHIRGLGVEIVEIDFSPSLGTSDRDTIGVNSKNSDGETVLDIATVAVVVEHEAKHIQNIRNSLTEAVFDPTTTGVPGMETHANMHFESIVDALDDYDRCAAVTPETCLALSLNLVAGGRWAERGGLDRPTPEEAEAQSYMNECCIF
ncbi:MAG: hypothetical protein WD226_05550 [Planctomycetota bacterium]